MGILGGLNVGVNAAVRELPTHVTDPASDEVHLAGAMEWLCRSQDKTDDGSSAATYNLLLGWADAYPETTGYIIPTMYSYAKRTNRQSFANRATRMADWLCGIQNQTGSFPGGVGTDGEPNVFNTGQIVFGLVDAYRQTGDESYKIAARNACDWLVDQQTSEGYWDTHDYGGEVHAYSTRISWALLEAGAVITDQTARYEGAARKNFDWAMDQQGPDGWFANASFHRGEAPYLHTIAYTIRGLLEGGLLLENQEIFAAASLSADKLLSIQQNTGILKGAYDSTWSPTWYYCLTGNAQTAIIWLRLFDETGDREYLHAARQSIEFLKRRQVLNGPDQISGSLPGSDPIVGPYMYLRYPNWGVKFFADALMLSEKHGKAPVKDDGSKDTQTCRLCLLCDGHTVQRWAADAITEVVEETNAEISLIVTNEETGLFSPEKIKRGKKYPAYASYWLANHVADTVRTGKEYKEPVEISALPGYSEARKIKTYPTNVDGLWNELPEEVVQEISQTTDVVVRRGFGLITGDILSAPENGVLSYHHGDPREFRGGPAGFWEFMQDKSTAGAMVQQLTDDLDGGAVLAYDEIDISDCRSWMSVRERLYTSSTSLLTAAVENVQSAPEDRLDGDRADEIYHPPSGLALGKYLWKRFLPKESRE